MTKPSDAELRNAFVQLQAKVVETSQKIQLIDAQIQGLNRVKQHVKITEREINSLTPETRTYESLGRMFILTDLNDVKTNLINRQTAAAEKITDLDNKKSYLGRDLKQKEDNLREMIQQRKDVSENKSIN